MLQYDAYVMIGSRNITIAEDKPTPEKAWIAVDDFLREVGGGLVPGKNCTPFVVEHTTRVLYREA